MCRKTSPQATIECQECSDLRAKVARLEAELTDNHEVERAFEALFEARCKLLNDTKRLGLCICKQRDKAWAANAALAAAGQRLRKELAIACPDCVDEALLREWDAALTDAGEARVWCERCGHRAALDALEGKWDGS